MWGFDSPSRYHRRSWRASATFRQPQQTAQLRVVKVDLPEASNVELRGGLIGVKHTDADFLTTEIIARLLAVRLKREAESNSAVFSVKSEPRILAGPLSFSASISADKAQEFSRQVTEAFASFAATPAVLATGGGLDTKFSHTGRVDLKFQPAGYSGEDQPGVLAGLLLQKDGKVVVGGHWTAPGGTGCVGWLARLKTDGTLDPSCFPFCWNS